MTSAGNARQENPNVQATFFATLVDEWVRSGITDAVVAPGNRSTLLSALLVRDGRIRVHTFVDERSGSFFALGMAKASGRTTIVWTTSGTAAVECHPAAVEAHHSRIPLLICTADRPPELHHSRDWQSIAQSKLYGDVLRWQFDPGVGDVAMSSSWRSIASRSVIETLVNPNGPGPVHLNLPIREPWSIDPGELPPGRADGKSWHEIEPSQIADRKAAATSARNDVPGRGVLVIGECDAEPTVLMQTAKRLGWPVLADARSTLRRSDPNVVVGFDALARSESFRREMAPDLVVQIGSPLVSKETNRWLGNCGADVVEAGAYEWAGGAVSANKRFVGRPDMLLQSLLCQPDTVWLERWRSADSTVQRTLDEELCELSEPAIARWLTKVMKPGNLFVATSMPVRDVDTFGVARDDVRVFANRGASGMDGLVSTAAGIANVAGATVMLTGDLSFLYDLGALWNIDRNVDLCIVVVDNDGGGIFSNIPQLGEHIETDVFKRVVATPHGLDIARLLRGFDIPCAELRSLDEMPEIFEGSGVRVVHVKTDRAATARLRSVLNSKIRDALG